MAALRCDPKDAEALMLEQMDALIGAPANPTLSPTSPETLNQVIVDPEEGRKSKKLTAVAGAVLGVVIFGLQNFSPSGLNNGELLVRAEKESMSVDQAVCSGKPLVIDFYAPWCESCKALAPTMRQLESRYVSWLFSVILLSYSITTSALGSLEHPL